MAEARIGEARVYNGPTCPLVYPGERAIAQFDSEEVERAIKTAFVLGRTQLQVEPIGWVVEPAPGLRSWWLRWRYRLIGRWWRRGRPRLEIVR